MFVALTAFLSRKIDNSFAFSPSFHGGLFVGGGGKWGLFNPTVPAGQRASQAVRRPVRR